MEPWHPIQSSTFRTRTSTAIRTLLTRTFQWWPVWSKHWGHQNLVFKAYHHHPIYCCFIAATIFIKLSPTWYDGLMQIHMAMKQQWNSIVLEGDGMPCWPGVVALMSLASLSITYRALGLDISPLSTYYPDLQQTPPLSAKPRLSQLNPASLS